MNNEKWTDNDIGNTGARAISEALKVNTTSAVLSLGGNKMQTIVKWIVIKNVFIFLTNNS